MPRPDGITHHRVDLTTPARPPIDTREPDLGPVLRYLQCTNPKCEKHRPPYDKDVRGYFKRWKGLDCVTCGYPYTVSNVLNLNRNC